MATEYHLSSWWDSENPISSPRAARARQPVGSRKQHTVWLPRLHTQGARESPPKETGLAPRQSRGPGCQRLCVGRVEPNQSHLKCLQTITGPSLLK